VAIGGNRPAQGSTGVTTPGIVPTRQYIEVVIVKMMVSSNAELAGRTGVIAGSGASA